MLPVRVDNADLDRLKKAASYIYIWPDLENYEWRRGSGRGPISRSLVMKCIGRRFSAGKRRYFIAQCIFSGGHWFRQIHRSSSTSVGICQVSSPKPPGSQAASPRMPMAGLFQKFVCHCWRGRIMREHLGKGCCLHTWMMGCRWKEEAGPGGFSGLMFPLPCSSGCNLAGMAPARSWPPPQLTRSVTVPASQEWPGQQSDFEQEGPQSVPQPIPAPSGPRCFRLPDHSMGLDVCNDALF